MQQIIVILDGYTQNQYLKGKHYLNRYIFSMILDCAEIFDVRLEIYGNNFLIYKVK